jgi:hypothetical protein
MECGRCAELELLYLNRTEEFISLVERQSRMFRNGEAQVGRELDEAMIAAKAAIGSRLAASQMKFTTWLSLSGGSKHGQPQRLQILEEISTKPDDRRMTECTCTGNHPHPWPRWLPYHGEDCLPK